MEVEVIHLQNGKEIMVNWESESIKFPCGEEIDFWWEDMRKREIVNLIVKVWNAGYKYAKVEVNDPCLAK